MRNRCRKKGHKLSTRNLEGLRKPDLVELFRAVAFNVEGKQAYCTRWFCGYESRVYGIEDGSSIQSLSMPSDDMKKLESSRCIWKGQYGYWCETEEGNGE